jgi:hypothetical protein
MELVSNITTRFTASAPCVAAFVTFFLIEFSIMTAALAVHERKLQLFQFLSYYDGAYQRDVNEVGSLVLKS